MFVSASCLFLLSSAAVAKAAEASDGCTKGIDVPADMNTSDWPKLFRLTTPYPEDPTASNMDDTADLVDPSVLMAAGVGYRFIDPTGYDYPNRTKEIPWSPPVNGTNDESLQEFRNENDFQYADIVVVSAYNEGFYEEHLHPGGDEVRYIIDGSGYFDIRDVNDEWVRMHAKAGDFVEFPSGIQHRFAVDDSLYVQAMRLFPGSGAPDWSSVSRSEVEEYNNNTARESYVEKYLCGVDPNVDVDHGHDDGDDHGDGGEAEVGDSHDDGDDHGHGDEAEVEVLETPSDEDGDDNDVSASELSSVSFLVVSFAAIVAMTLA